MSARQVVCDVPKSMHESIWQKDNYLQLARKVNEKAIKMFQKIKDICKVKKIIV